MLLLSIAERIFLEEEGPCLSAKHVWYIIEINNRFSKATGTAAAITTTTATQQPYKYNIYTAAATLKFLALLCVSL